MEIYYAINSEINMEINNAKNNEKSPFSVGGSTTSDG